jgi:hypothetical protein
MMWPLFWVRFGLSLLSGILTMAGVLFSSLSEQWGDQRALSLLLWYELIAGPRRSVVEWEYYNGFVFA